MFETNRRKINKQIKILPNIATMLQNQIRQNNKNKIRIAKSSQNIICDTK